MRKKFPYLALTTEKLESRAGRNLSRLNREFGGCDSTPPQLQAKISRSRFKRASPPCKYRASRGIPARA
jgi:hypothetical protein